MRALWAQLKNKLIAHKLMAIGFSVSLALAVGGWLWAHIYLGSVGQPLIIHFNSSSGITQVGETRDLIGIGIFAVLAVMVNFFIAMSLEERDWFWGKLLAAATVGFAALIFIGFAAIISVN